MNQWKKFFAGLATLGEVILPIAIALYSVAQNKAWTKSSHVLKLVIPKWQETILSAFNTLTIFVSPYLLWIGLAFIFCVAIGPQNFSRRLQILWNALWIFFVFNVALFFTEIADPFKMPFWPNLANFAAALIAEAKKIFSFNIYVGWAAGIAFVYSLTIYLKDLVSAFLIFFVGFLDRRLKPVLVDELKTTLGVRLIKTPANLIPITPSLLGLILFIFAIGALPLLLPFLLPPDFQNDQVIPVLNILGAAILTYGFIQIFGVFFIFLTGLIYYLGKKIFGRPQPPTIPVFR